MRAVGGAIHLHAAIFTVDDVKALVVGRQADAARMEQLIGAASPGADCAHVRAVGSAKHLHAMSHIRHEQQDAIAR